MDVEYFERLWQKEEKYRNAGGGEKSICWDKRADDFNKNVHDERRKFITGLLIDKGMLDKESVVLDIGCGPGKFAVDFGLTAKSVVGLDISPKMLRFAGDNAAAKGLKNICFELMDWKETDLEAANWRKKFSLVTAIMSPALSNRKALDKMMEASNGYCLISHFMERHDSVRDVMQKDILGREKEDIYGNRSIYCSFNILWLYKLFPEIVYFNSERETLRPLEEAAHYYNTRLEMRKALTPVQKAEILEFLKGKAENGFIKERTSAKVACIYWKNR